jgi:hypothetical protein
VILEGEASDGFMTFPVSSAWTHSPEDPLVVKVDFKGHEAVWRFSLDLLMEAFTSSSEGLQGSGDVLVEVGEEFSFIHLSNGRESGTLKFSTADIQEFLNQVDLQDSEEVINRELDQFLNAL